MVKGDLFSIKTNYGYGLFQVFDSYPKNYHLFNIIYRTQVRTLSEKEIQEALNGEYYYERLFFKLSVRFYKFDVEKIIENKGVEFSAIDFGIDINDYYFGNCYISYLGNYSVPPTAEIPRFTREVSMSYFTGKHYWLIHDDMLLTYVSNEKGNMKKFKTLTPEIISYPLYLVRTPRMLVDHFNTDYTPCDYNDAYIDKIIEEEYIKYPDLRPSKEKYADVKYPLPIVSQEKDEDTKNDKKYMAFCKVLEQALTKFIQTIDEDKKKVKKALNELINELNKIEKDTGSIGTLEAEEIYSYLAKVLGSLRKANLIELIEEKREW